ncbi:MAG: DNA mismatch repair endonuclease MutL [Alphaproteobacteria bacterium]|nr:DNA mismatch repair endonuclease MutL [Alphaproteobacteria bacterium]
MTIRLLPSHLVNQIAAGEVIERPAAVVKELVENALDAGATRVDVTTREGGVSAITVQDNGDGMSADELKLAVERHATSKLPEDNLEMISSFGFRGEALPSIASVSRMTITSRKRGSNDAWNLQIEGGVMRDVKPASLSQGTRIDVQDLFYATPARLKFLKSLPTEYGHILESLERLAMAWPAVSFSLFEDGRKPWRCEAVPGLFPEQRKARLGAILGADFANNAIPVDASRGGVNLSGWIGLPTLNRAFARDQYLFVNNRPVRDRVLLGAVKAAYGDLIPHGRHAVVALFLDMPMAEVDVNVHPAKLEVRFRDGALIRGLIISTLRQALHAEAKVTSNTLSDATLHSFQASQSFHRAAAPYGGQQTYNWQSPPEQHYEQQRSMSGFSEVAQPFAKQYVNNDFAAVSQQDNSPNTQAQDFPLGAALAQIHETYIVAQTADGLVLVDQHAAHERLTYERMKAALASGGVKRQGLLIPEVVELSDLDATRILEKQSEFAELGLIIEPFGGNAIVVHEIPALLNKTNIPKLIQDLAAEIGEWGHAISLKEKLEEVCSTIACHGSIRAGRALNCEEMNTLLRQMEATPHSGQCNHGRPTYIELKFSDVEKLFQRK